MARMKEVYQRQIDAQNGLANILRAASWHIEDDTKAGVVYPLTEIEKWKDAITRAFDRTSESLTNNL